MLYTKIRFIAEIRYFIVLLIPAFFSADIWWSRGFTSINKIRFDQPGIWRHNYVTWLSIVSRAGHKRDQCLDNLTPFQVQNVFACHYTWPFFTAHWDLVFFKTVLTVKSAAPQNALWGGSWPRFESGTGGIRPPHLLVSKLHFDSERQTHFLYFFFTEALTRCRVVTLSHVVACVPALVFSL